MMADRDSSRAKKERPHNREVENENLRPPAKEGERPRPATEPPGWRNRQGRMSCSMTGLRRTAALI